MYFETRLSYFIRMPVYYPVTNNVHSSFAINWKMTETRTKTWRRFRQTYTHTVNVSTEFNKMKFNFLISAFYSFFYLFCRSPGKENTLDVFASAFMFLHRSVLLRQVTCVQCTHLCGIWLLLYGNGLLSTIFVTFCYAQRKDTVKHTNFDFSFF